MAIAKKQLPSSSKPKLGPEYESWLDSVLGVKNLKRHERHYETVTNQVLDSLLKSALWDDITKQIREINARYKIEKSFDLLAAEPKLIKKPWKSFLEKTYRKNILTNELYPNPPEDGWLMPPRWHFNIKDVVRTSIVIRYLDGIKIILDALTKIGADRDIYCTFDLDARIQGYYAAHFYYKVKCNHYTVDHDDAENEFFLEIQVTTQIKEIIKSLLHNIYKEERLGPSARSLSQLAWDYQHPSFVPAYLAHLLHYVESMIIQARDKTGGPNV